MSPAEWACEVFRDQPRRASHRLTLEHLCGWSDRHGWVRGHTREAIGEQSGVKWRQARYILAELQRCSVIRIFKRPGRPNDYRVLTAAVLALIAADERSRSGSTEIAGPPARAPRLHPRVWPNGMCIHSTEACAECRSAS